MNTDKGTNVLGLIGLAATAASSLPDGHVKVVILTILALFGCGTLFMTKGYQPPVDDKSIEEVVKEGRE